MSHIETDLTTGIGLLSQVDVMMKRDDEKPNKANIETASCDDRASPWFICFSELRAKL